MMGACPNLFDACTNGASALRHHKAFVSFGSKHRREVRPAACPLHPHEPTSSARLGTSEKCDAAFPSTECRERHPAGATTPKNL
jgi:hypothetical protein